jgi:hypothetical protein
MTKRKIQYWVIPPEADPEFIASMEEILDTYEEPYDPDYPKVCMDEQPVQLHKEIRKPIPGTRSHARRVDYEYERCGTACVFMFTEPLSGWRQATARPQRTKVDWALEMAALLGPPMSISVRNSRSVSKSLLSSIGRTAIRSWANQAAANR